MMLVFRLRIMRNLSALCAAVEEKLFLMETSGVAADSGITNTDSRLKIQAAHSRDFSRELAAF